MAQTSRNDSFGLDLLAAAAISHPELVITLCWHVATVMETWMPVTVPVVVEFDGCKLFVADVTLKRVCDMIS